MWEGSFRVNYTDAFDIDGKSKSKAKIDADTSWGFSLGYHFNNYLLVNMSVDIVDSDYKASYRDSTDASATKASSDLDLITTHFNTVYHFIPKRFTPFVQAGIGWSYIDSNISKGPATGSCWWGPWWGHVCHGYQDNYDDTRLSYSLGAGLRYEFANNVLMRGSYQQNWIDMNRASTADTGVVLFEIGSTF